MSVPAAQRLIVALDVAGLSEAVALVERLAELGVLFKVGLEPLLTYGDAILARLEAAGAPSFVDAKLHDIPRTVAAATRALLRPGVRMLSVHALGGREMMRAAVEAAALGAHELGLAAPGVFAVTLLTSIGRVEADELGLPGALDETVLRLATLACEAGCAGVVCAPGEVARLKGALGESFTTICPGIRPAGDAPGDQKRIATPGAALRAGADYLVVGRPITEAADPLAASRAIVAEMGASHVR